MKITDLFMDEERLTEGTRVPIPLETPDGSPVDAWVELFYVHSDEAQKRFARAMRDDQAKGETIEADNELSILKRYAHCLVAGWSFEEEPTLDTVRDAMRLIPDLRSTVIYWAQQKRLFFPKPAESSSGGQKKKSNS